MDYWVMRFLLFLLSLRSFAELVYVEVPLEGLHPILFSSPQALNYKSIRLIDDVVYIGGNGTLFIQNPENISTAMSNAIHWAATEEQKRSCLTLPQGRTPANCENFISVIQPYNSTHLLLCGSMALEPSNTFFNIEEKRIEQSSNLLQTALCSYDPSDAVTSVLATRGGVFSGIAGTFREIGTKMALIKNLQDSSILRTSQDDGNMIGEDSTFIASFSAEDSTQQNSKKLYFVFGENSVDPSNNGYASRIAQVCANDVGGDGIFEGKWTSFLKTELVCQSNEKSPTKFNVITDIKITENGILYGTFKTQSAHFRLSAVCSFKLADIQHAFNSNDFIGEDFKVVGKPESITDRPGMCSYPGLGGNSEASSKNFPTNFLNFIKKHPVVTSLTPSHPLYTSTDETFEKIDVQQVTSLNGDKYDILFIANSNGNIIKYASNGKTGFKRVLASFSLSPSKITGIDINPGINQVYVKTVGNVIQFSTSSCEAYTSTCAECEPCRMCALSQDPMCAWDINGQVCTPITGMTNSINLIQDVENGKVDRCNVLNETSDQMSVSYGSSVVLGIPLQSSTITTKWSRKLSGGVLQPIQENSKYFVTREGRLEINDFSQSDEGVYVCERIVSSVVVARTLFNVDSPLSTLPPVPSSKPGVVTSKTSIPGPLTPPTPTTDTATATLIPGPNTGEISGGTIAMIVIILLLVLIGVFLTYWFCRKRSRDNQYNTGETKYQKGVTVTDAVTFGQESNNSNNKIIGAELMSVSLIDGEDKRDDYIFNQEKKSVSPLTANPRQIAAIKPLPKGGISSSDTLPYIDDPDNNILPSPRNRKPPQRSKSIPASNILVQLGKDQSFRCKNARKSLHGTWVLEVDIADYEITNETSFDQNGLESFGSANNVEKGTPTSQHSGSSGLLADEVLQAFDSKFLPRQDHADTDSDSTIKAFPSNGDKVNPEPVAFLPPRAQPAAPPRLNKTAISVRDKSTRNEKSPRSTTSTDSNSSSADRFHTAPPSPLKTSNPPML